MADDWRPRRVDLAEVNERRKLVRRIPSRGQITDWIAQSKALPPVVMH